VKEIKRDGDLRDAKNDFSLDFLPIKLKKINSFQKRT
jgi:hypothetical protein